MAPVIPFIPLIAAGLGAAGGITASIIGKKNQSAGSLPSTSSPLAATEDNNKQGIISGGSASPLGDTTNPNLQRGKLLGN